MAATAPEPEEQSRRPQQERARRTRERILEAAATAFARDGYEGTSLNELIRASGVTKGAFYFHFGSKEELALATFRHKQEQIVARAETEDTPDAAAELRAVLRIRARLYAEDPSLRSILRLGAELGATAGADSEFARFHELTIETFAGIVRRGQADRTMRSDVHPRRAGEAIFAATIGADRVSRMLAGGSDLEQRGHELLDLLLLGLAARGSPRPAAGRAAQSRRPSRSRGEMSSHGIAVGPLEEGDVDAADRVFRLAFGTELGVPDPGRFAEGTEMVRTRWAADPAGAFKAEADGELVGCAFATRWGSSAVFGPLAVHPDHWNRGVGRRLWEARLPLLNRWGMTHAGLFTRPDTRHIHLYQTYDFWPGFLTALTAKEVGEGEPADAPAEATADALAACRSLADGVYPGLDLEREIRAVDAQRLGGTVLVDDEDGLAGFAVCHVGRGSEGGPDTCFVKFAAARPGTGAADRFAQMLDAVEGYARTAGASRLTAGVNLGRHGAYRALLARGHRPLAFGIAMHRANEPAYDRSDAWVIDDRR
ncbi:MAG: GNAT family N-acetyltransferase [Verrucomicrobiota bacterium]